MKYLKLMLRSMLSIVVWGLVSTGLFIATLFIPRLFGINPGGRQEILLLLGAIGIVALPSILSVILLFRNKRKVEAMSILIVGCLVGTYMLLLIATFSGG